MEDLKNEWLLFNQTWKDRVVDSQRINFESLDHFMNNVLIKPIENNNFLSGLERITVTHNPHKIKRSDDKKTLFISKCPFHLKMDGSKISLPVTFIFANILDALLLYISKRNSNIMINNFNKN